MEFPFQNSRGKWADRGALVMAICKLSAPMPQTSPVAVKSGPAAVQTDGFLFSHKEKLMLENYPLVMTNIAIENGYL